MHLFNNFFCCLHVAMSIGYLYIIVQLQPIPKHVTCIVRGSGHFDCDYYLPYDCKLIAPLDKHLMLFGGQVSGHIDEFEPRSLLNFSLECNGWFVTSQYNRTAWLFRSEEYRFIKSFTAQMKRIAEVLNTNPNSK